MYKRHKKETEKAEVSRFGDNSHDFIEQFFRNTENRPAKDRIMDNLTKVFQTLNDDMEYYSMIDSDHIQEAINYIRSQENIDLVTKKCQALEWKIADLKIEVNGQTYEMEELKSKNQYLLNSMDFFSSQKEKQILDNQQLKNQEFQKQMDMQNQIYQKHQEIVEKDKQIVQHIWEMSSLKTRITEIKQEFYEKDSNSDKNQDFVKLGKFFDQAGRDFSASLALLNFAISSCKLLNSSEEVNDNKKAQLVVHEKSQQKQFAKMANMHQNYLTGMKKAQRDQMQENERLLNILSKNLADECIICQESIQFGQRAEEFLNCKHDSFHKSCITRWTKLKKLCPICRQKV